MTVVVADTGIYVSALVFGGVPQSAVIQILYPPFSLAVSEEIKAELTETLTRKLWVAGRARDGGLPASMGQCTMVRACCRSSFARS